MTTSDAAPTPRLRLTNIVKTYGGVRALRHADLMVEAGQVHALVGENGAGKSTLIKIVSGAERADSGTIEFDGERTMISSTSDAIALGIQTVYQEPHLFPELSVAENIFVGRELSSGPLIRWSDEADKTQSLLETVGLPPSIAATPVGQLTIAEQQQVSIAKALASDATVLILDEPSAILTDSEIDVLFGVIRRMISHGVAVIYISHRLDELFRIAHEVTVMRNGETIVTRPIGELTVRQIAELMVGGEVTESRGREFTDGTPVLELEALSRGSRFTGIDLTVRKGEIVGIYGLIGSGAGDITASVYGIAPPTSGVVRFQGQRVRIRRPSTARRLGIALLPANRAAQGSFSFQSIAFNITIASLRQLSRVPGWISRRTERRIADDYIRRLAIKTPSSEQPISAMSGGNAQKVILARQLVRMPALLLLDEPTQGVDVGAKEEIHRNIEALADGGTAVLVTTSDLGEVLRISDRILVVRAGGIVAEFRTGATQVEILAAAAGEVAAA